MAEEEAEEAAAAVEQADKEVEGEGAAAEGEISFQQAVDTQEARAQEGDMAAPAVPEVGAEAEATVEPERAQSRLGPKAQS